MFGQQHNTYENNKVSETPQERIQRIKRTKNIRKEKVQKKRGQINAIQELSSQYSGKMRDKMTREQKAEIQKQKNRIAAQQSRDKQKIHLSNLEKKIQELQNIVSKQLCIKCRDPLVHESSTNQQSQEQRSVVLDDCILDEEERIQNNPFEQESRFQFFRQQTSESLNSIGKFLFICMVSVALISFSASLQGGPMMVSENNRLLQAIAPANVSIKNKPEDVGNMFSTSLCESTTLRSTLLANTFKKSINSQNTENDCKNDYIEDYFLENEDLDFPEDRFELPRKQHYSHYNNDRLLNCARPQLIMKKQAQDSDRSFFSGLFTVVLDNPEIMEVISNKGVMYLDNVVSLRGLYEIEVKFMNIKKVISQSCLS